MTNKATAVAVTCLVLAVASPAQADDLGSLRPVKPGRPLTIAAVRQMPGLLGLTFIDAERRFVAVAQGVYARPGSRSVPAEPPWNRGTSYILHFYRREGHRLFKVAEFESEGIFVGMNSEREATTELLHTYWAGGAWEGGVTFAIEGDRVVKVFEWVERDQPREFIHLANDERAYMVIGERDPTDIWGVWKPPRNARIYAWEGNRYVLKKTVPWLQRFDAFKDQWPKERPKE